MGNIYLVHKKELCSHRSTGVTVRCMDKKCKGLVEVKKK